jgi:hypothetical protein
MLPSNQMQYQAHRNANGGTEENQAFIDTIRSKTVDLRGHRGKRASRHDRGRDRDRVEPRCR